MGFCPPFWCAAALGAAVLSWWMIYFTPQPRKRKELFPSFFPSLKFFHQRSREGTKQPPGRGGQNPDRLGRRPKGQGQNPADPGAEEGEVGRRPQHQAQGDVQPHPAVAQHHPAEEEAGAGPHPEQQVQQLPRPPPGQAAAALAEQVVQHPHPHAHGQALQQHLGLLLQGDAHPRSSLPKKPSRTGSSSS